MNNIIVQIVLLRINGVAYIKIQASLAARRVLGGSLILNSCVVNFKTTRSDTLWKNPTIYVKRYK